MNKILLSLMVSFLCITQGGIAFSESETANNTSAATIITAEHGIKPYESLEPTLLLKNINVEQYKKTYYYDTFDIVTDGYGRPIDPTEVSRVYIDGKESYTGEIDTNVLGSTHTVQIMYIDKGSPYYSNYAIVTVIPLSNKASITLKDATILVDQKWDPKMVFVSAANRFGVQITWEEAVKDLDAGILVNGNRFGKIDTSKPSEYMVQAEMQDARGLYTIRSNEVKVIVKRPDATLKTKDSTIYQGEKWKPKDNFVSVIDEKGKSVPWQDPRISVSQAIIDTSKPGVHKIKYFFKGVERTICSESTITVKEDQTSLKTKDSTLYTGQKWDPKDNFISATDEEGKSVPWGDPRITKENDANIDTSKPGVHKIKYTYKGKVKNVEDKVTVTVKEDQTKAELKDDELYVGQKWDLGRVFKKVVDKDGSPIKSEQVKYVWIDSKETKEIDTSKPGKHTLSLAILNAKNEWVYSNKVTVTVKEELFIIKQVPYFDFDDHILGSTNKSVANNKETPIIELETPSIVVKDWQLQVELSPFVDKKNEKNVLKGVSLFIPKGKLESDLETEEPSQYECKLEANGKASILMNGTKAKGKGRWKNKLETKEITLSIPSENKIGAFESTLHWTLLDVPT